MQSEKDLLSNPDEEVVVSEVAASEVNINNPVTPVEKDEATPKSKTEAPDQKTEEALPAKTDEA